jgi:hypothetical protein
MLKNILVLVFLCVAVIGLGLLYGGIGWCAAWVLEKATDVNVNYSVFVWVAVGIYVLKLVVMGLFYLFTLKKQAQFEREFANKWKVSPYKRKRAEKFD